MSIDLHKSKFTGRMECVDVDYIVSFSFLLECTVGESCPMEIHGKRFDQAFLARPRKVDQPRLKFCQES